jgi:hypothetical protein
LTPILYLLSLFMKISTGSVKCSILDQKIGGTTADSKMAKMEMR